nr:unnamed protein product [Spirometra erinaceieuropaei]
MGSPISGFIAEAVLQRFESLVFQHHRPKFWARYVDDTFVVIEWDQVLTFKERLNSVFPDIQFTMEEEENNQLAFLDVHVCRKDCGGLKTKVFKKATNTTQILNFNSNHPICHKRNCNLAVLTIEQHFSNYYRAACPKSPTSEVLSQNVSSGGKVYEQIEEGREFDFAATKAIANVENKKKRKLIEAWVSEEEEESVRRRISLPNYRALRSHLQTCLADY